MTGSPLPTLSNAIAVPSFECTLLIELLAFGAEARRPGRDLNLASHLYVERAAAKSTCVMSWDGLRYCHGRSARDTADVIPCLSSIILSPLNGDVKMSPHATG